MIRKLLLTFFLVVNLLQASSVLGQTTGDYRSNVNTTGIWATAGNWEYFNGSTWVTATNYPGQVAGTYAVLIQAGDVITIGTTGITTQTMGTLTIDGSLILTGTNTGGAGTNFIFETQTVIVTPLLGTITFIDKVNLKLPANGTLQVKFDLTPTPDYYGLIGDCNHNQDIFIGSSTYAYCNGGGSTGLTFYEVMGGGGTLNSTPSSNSPICSGDKIMLYGSSIGPIGSGITYTWAITDPSGTPTTIITKDASIVNAITGNYVIKLTCSTVYGSVAYSNSETVTVVVNASPSTPSGTSSQLFCASTNPTVANLSATGTAIKWYATSTGGSALATTTSLVNGTHYYASQTSGCESSSRLDVTATVSPISVGGTVAGGTTICSGSTSGLLTLSGQTGVITKWQSSVSPFLTWADISNTTTTYISGILSETTKFRAVVQSGSCETLNSIDTTVTVNVLNTPSVGTPTQPTCSSTTGSVVLSGLPASGTINQSGTVVASYPITGVTMTISGLASGTYTYAVSSGTCISIPSSSVVIDPLVTKTWDGTAWSPLGLPTSDNLVIIDGNYNTTSLNPTLNACSLVINSGYTLTIEAGTSVIVQNDLTVNGVLDVLDQGSLVMINDLGKVTNSGTTNIHRFTTSFKQYDYTYWSTPVVSTDIATTFLSKGWHTENTYEYVPANFEDVNDDGYDDNGDDWSFATTMNPGKGYIIMVPTPTSAPGGKVSEVVFSGKVNNGIQKISGIIPDRSYLLGNPYPSAIDADKFLIANKDVLVGTLYFWTHNTALNLASAISNPGMGWVYAYSSDDYATYNATGGVGIAPAPDSDVLTGSAPSSVSPYTGINNNTPSGKIASGQGFFGSSQAGIPIGSEIVFNNSMRVDNLGNTLDNSQFFKSRNPKDKTANAVEKHRIWLNLKNTQGAFKQTLVGYITDATNEYDSRFDGESYDGNEFVDFYSVNQDKNLVIQGRALPFDENDVVPLGFRSTIDGEFTINIDQVDGLLTDQAVFIEDKLTNTTTDLKSGAYIFTTTAGTFNDRFVLRYNNKTLGTTNFDVQTNKVLVSNKSKEIKINSFAETIDKVTIYDLLGKQIYQKFNVDSKELSILNLVSNNQTLLVKTTLQNRKTVTNKIIY